MLDYLSAILLIIGYIITGRKIKWGWIFAALGNLGYIIVAINKELPGMLYLSIVMLAVSLYNFMKWSETK